MHCRHAVLFLALLAAKYTEPNSFSADIKPREWLASADVALVHASLFFAVFYYSIVKARVLESCVLASKTKYLSYDITNVVHSIGLYSTLNLCLDSI